MTTVGQLVDATFRLWLEPPDYQPSLAFLQADVTDVSDAWPLGNWALPEDEQLMRVGAVLEAGSELVRVVSYDSVSATATVRRAEMGTGRAAHTQGTPVKLSPPFPRLDVFGAVRANIASLSPRLFSVRVAQLVETDVGVAPLGDELGVSVIEVMRDNRMMPEPKTFTIIDYHPATGQRSVLFPPGLGNVWVRYRRRTGDAQSEDQDLEELGVEELWIPAVLVGAAADLLVGRDLPETHVQWVSQVLRADNIKVGARQTVAFGLTQYRDLLIDRFHREMTQEYRSVSIVQRNPWAYITEGGLR